MCNKTKMSEEGPVGKRRPLSRHLSTDTTECTQMATSNFQLAHTLDLSDETTLVPETDRSEEPVRFCFGFAAHCWYGYKGVLVAQKAYRAARFCEDKIAVESGI